MLYNCQPAKSSSGAELWSSKGAEEEGGREGEAAKGCFASGTAIRLDTATLGSKKSPSVLGATREW